MFIHKKPYNIRSYTLKKKKSLLRTLFYDCYNIYIRFALNTDQIITSIIFFVSMCTLRQVFIDIN